MSLPFARRCTGVETLISVLLRCRFVVLFCSVTAVTFFGMGSAVAQPAGSAPENRDDFGQYLVDHQDDLLPFFSQNASEIFRHGVPALMGLLGWIFVLTMLAGWGIDVLLSRAYAFFYAPAQAEWKRSLIYATGRLFLTFLYACLISLIIILVLGLAHAALIVLMVVIILGLVAIAAQLVWILYLFRTDFGISLLFYLAILVLHLVAGVLIAQPILATRASPQMTNFVDQTITPRLQEEAQATRRQLADVTSGRDSAQAKVTDCQNQIAQAAADQGHLAKEIEEKKNSDRYLYSQIVKLRARGDLKSARDQLAAFADKFPASPLVSSAHAQLAAVVDQMTVEEATRRQQQADTERAAAQARADLLAKAAQGTLPLSEMRHALLGKSRAQVSDLLGAPTDTGSDRWSYRKQMILNAQTGEKSGLTVYFSQGTVQSVDYDQGGNP